MGGIYGRIGYRFSLDRKSQMFHKHHSHFLIVQLLFFVAHVFAFVLFASPARSFFNHIFLHYFSIFQDVTILEQGLFDRTILQDLAPVLSPNS